MRIGILGPESTGKTTLAQQIARERNGILIPEYARDYVANLGRDYTYEDLEIIARQQIQEFDLGSKTMYNWKEKTIFVYDTEMIITKVWFIFKYGHCPDWVEEFVRTHKMDEYLLCYPDIPWEADPTRENGNQTIREQLFAIYEQELKAINANYKIVKHN